MKAPHTLRRAAVLVSAAALTVAVAAGAGAAVLAGAGDGRNGPSPSSGAPDPAAVLLPTGSELQFVAVAPCRIIDTRKAGGAITAGSRTFDASLGSYAAQGGLAGTCNIPGYAASIQLNLGAISQNNKTSDIRGWATGTAEPTASLVNYNPAGPVANMVTMPVNGSGQFTLKTPGAAHIFADVAGFYVKPLYAVVDPDGNIFQSKASGVVSVVHAATGLYEVTFQRDVERCAVTAATLEFSSNRDASPENQDGRGSTVVVGVADPAGVLVDTWFAIRASC